MSRKDLAIRLKQMKKPGLQFLHLDLEQLKEKHQGAADSGHSGLAALPSASKPGHWEARRHFQGSCSIHNLDNSCFPLSHVNFPPLLLYHSVSHLSLFPFLSFFTVCSKLWTLLTFHPPTNLLKSQLYSVPPSAYRGNDNSYSYQLSRVYHVLLISFRCFSKLWGWCANQDRPIVAISSLRITARLFPPLMQSLEPVFLAGSSPERPTFQPLSMCLNCAGVCLFVCLFW